MQNELTTEQQQNIMENPIGALGSCNFIPTHALKDVVVSNTK